MRIRNKAEVLSTIVSRVIILFMISNLPSHIEIDNFSEDIILKTYR